MSSKVMKVMKKPVALGKDDIRIKVHIWQGVKKYECESVLFEKKQTFGEVACMAVDHATKLSEEFPEWQVCLDGAKVYYGGERMDEDKKLKDVKNGEVVEVYLPSVITTDSMAEAVAVAKVVKEANHSMMPPHVCVGTFFFNNFFK